MESEDKESKKKSDGREKDDDYEDEDYYYDGSLLKSIRSGKTGVEIGIEVSWPNVRPFLLSTRLDSKELAPLFHGTQWAGTRIWNASLVAIQYLLLNVSSSSSVGAGTTMEASGDFGNKNNQDEKLLQGLFRITRQTRFLELGCGLGLPGILLHEMADCSVVLTDREALVDQLRSNLGQIFPGDSRIEAHVLDWSEQGVWSLLNKIHSTTTTSLLGEKGQEYVDSFQNGPVNHPREDCGDSEDSCWDPLQRHGFDLVLNCDCVYEPLYGKESWQSLITCQRVLLQINPLTLFVHSFERRKEDGVENFLQALENMVCCHVQRVSRLPFPHPPNIEIYLAWGSEALKRCDS